jgi:hypothetical protein
MCRQNLVLGDHTRLAKHSWAIAILDLAPVVGVWGAAGAARRVHIRTALAFETQHLVKILITMVHPCLKREILNVR